MQARVGLEGSHVRVDQQCAQRLQLCHHRWKIEHDRRFDRRASGLSLTISTRSPCSACFLCRSGVWVADSGAGRVSSGWKLLPCPSLLSTASSPPFRATSRWEIDRPRPVPLQRRVVEASACREFAAM